ncbi:family 10 glycosylhydrolase [Microcoleus sp. FACHB-68]|uniref:glycoside hydrolase family 10 protein n=1 Tax=Microcoleus sp. FACHB-68 TaxID=2692826 RepID=UPI00168436E6|nr:family 10 glycosylhydrolase [Microcoleus sp. FACHB-68]MBD1937040.1 family 10 glycosylhydrolase [Microcoleus sp. FACHB-68]
MVTTGSQFSDIQTHWARPFIEGLRARNIISGFPDGTFRPDKPISRAEYAAVLQRAFKQPLKRQYVPFVDVAPGFWAASAIQQAYETEFLSGYPEQRFRPGDQITRAQVLISLVSGLGITVENAAGFKAKLPQFYQDAAGIPDYATDKVAIATGAGMVVNYPNLKSLQPFYPATRADVVAFIYQALVKTGQAPLIESNYIVPTTPLAAVGHTREFRGAWVTTVWSRDWPSQPGLPVEQQKAELIAILDRLKSLNFNAVILQVRPEGDAIYPSQLEPWSYWLTGTQGKAPNPYYDPLEFAVEESHKRNLELHAWFNPYRAKGVINDAKTVAPHISVTHPEYVYKYGNELWMDPGAAVVQDLTYNVVMDVVRRYDIDGVHVDDYFYPYPKLNIPFPDNKTYAAYQAAGGKMSLGDWRRENVNKLVFRLGQGIRAIKSHVKFGISPFGIFRPGQPAQIQGLDSYDQLYTDSKKWLVEGWIDYYAPQLYWVIDRPAQSYPVLLKWWLQNNPKGKHFYVGNTIERIDGTSWPLQETQRQIEITRSLNSQMALGNIFYSMKVLNENRHGIADKFKQEIYAKPALAPTMPALDSTPPTLPKGVKRVDNQIVWNAVANNDIRAWTLYRQNGQTWTLVRVMAASRTSTAVEPGTYALSAVDRMSNESLGVIISI